MSTNAQLDTNGPKSRPSPTQIKSPHNSRMPSSSPPAPMSTLASETSYNTGSQRPSRRVARRACLSCREKKIKCDGEPVCAISSADGVNKVVPEKTRICSNCKFLGIECVFVQSNRGGRRKRRDVNDSVSQTGSATSTAQLKKIRTDSSNTGTFTNENDIQDTTNGVTTNEDESVQSSTARVSSFILGGKDKPSVPIPGSIPSNLPTPLDRMPPPMSSTSESQNIRSEHVRTFSKAPYPEFDDMVRSDTTRSNSYDFPRFPFASRPGGGRRYEDIDRPDETETESSFRLSSVPPPKGPRDGRGTPSPRGFGRGLHRRGPPPPHHHHHHMEDYYSLPPPPPPPPFGFHHGPPPPFPPPFPPPPPPPPGHFPHFHPHFPPPPPPPHFHHHYKMHKHHPHHHRRRFYDHHYEEGDSAEERCSSKPRDRRKNERDSYSESSHARSKRRSSISSSCSTSSSESDRKGTNSSSASKFPPREENYAASVDEYKPVTSQKSESIVATPRQVVTKVSKQPFSDSDLAGYDLPKWETLDKVLTSYYIYNQPNHQLFPGKSILLKNLSLNMDSSVLHAIIATICITATRQDPSLPISNDENYWINKVYKFWDTLNGIGIMICYKLIPKCTSFRYDMSKINQVNATILDTIQENNYVEIYSQKRFEFQQSEGKKSRLPQKNPMFGTSRQIYEREIVLRLIWSFYIHHIILLRFNQGRPYYKLSMIVDDFKFDYERDHYSNNILLPLNDYDFMTLKLVNNRPNWKQLYEKSYVPSDSSSLILASKIFEGLLSKLSNDELNFDNLISSNEFNFDFTNKIKTQHISIKKDKKLIVVNVSYWFANMILRVSEVLQYNHFIYDVMKFKMYKHEFKHNVEEIDHNKGNNNQSCNTPIICDEVLDCGDLADQLHQFASNQWQSVIEIVKSVNGFISLIEFAPSSEYEDYAIVLGPTLINNDEPTGKTNTISNVINRSTEWYDSPELQTTVKQSWNKLPPYALSFSAGFLSVVCSLAVLTKYVRLKGNPDSKCLVVEFIQTGDVKEFLDVNVDNIDGFENAAELFNTSVVLKQVSTLCEFIKFKLSYSNTDIMQSTIRKMNKITQHLESILSN
ncbi:Zcf31 zinc-finger protein [Candida orthopsilosis Co 90-125]|uniref:Zcf31 zinc-finger protein n=1 Tax=Candida orthopsilosis (strain 90-125) TaxID=1136231 RepID=H8X3Y4_CANO9|nr:Zcf31 zinc-finger protein [Candida orthopsilosis Co 90-125]CCG25772.1 Zcf31 zinc-finger protein [Candida orthopsilosis Co 90-125]